MKNQNTEFPLETAGQWSSTIAVAALPALLAPVPGQARPMEESGLPIGDEGGNVTNRPLSDFLDAQGTSTSFFPAANEHDALVPSIEEAELVAADGGNCID